MKKLVFLTFALCLIIIANGQEYVARYLIADERGKYGFIDNMGREIIPCKYDSSFGFSIDGLAAVEMNGKWGFVDETGKEVVPIKYDYVDWFYDGLAMDEDCD